MGIIERRGLNSELRASNDGAGRRIVGYAAVFNTPTQIGGPIALGNGFTERVHENAFAACLRSPDLSVVCTFNHNPDAILGRTPKTLRLSADSKGLRFECQVPDTQLGASILTSISRGDITGASIGFQVEADDWPEKNSRVIRQATLFDAGPVTFPAYAATSVSVRSASGTLESVQLAWYRAGKLRLPLTDEKEIRSKMRKLRQEMGADEADECSCECQACEDDDCESCNCSMGDMGMNCDSGDSTECNCMSRRSAQGRMQPSCQTIYPSDAGPLYREMLQRERQLEQELFDARTMMKRWR
jgi:HK97 family phage prohead protease